MKLRAWLAIYTVCALLSSAHALSANNSDNLAVKQTRLLTQALEQIPLDNSNIYSRYERTKLLYQIVTVQPNNDQLNDVIDTLEQLRHDPAFMQMSYRRAELMAYLGSAYTLKARDFPFGWIINNLTPIGFFRLYYVIKGTNMLHQAIGIEPEHPVVRLIRANTLTHLPRPFIQYNDGMRDFQLLLSWLSEEHSNTTYKEIIQDSTFASNVYFSAAQFYGEREEYDDAVKFAILATQRASDTELSDIASNLLSTLRQTQGDKK